MKKVLGSLTALAIIVAAGAAIAADATGRVTKIGTSSITLGNGQNYQMSKSLSAKALSAKGIKTGDVEGPVRRNPAADSSTRRAASTSVRRSLMPMLRQATAEVRITDHKRRH